ncbi:MAG: hypothetical protein LJE92_02395 [Gammaproteobacteria bacterium]|jgi:hypothetical protein|nr:hypothetical protein [Gammaproteobacteria bacterium]
MKHLLPALYISLAVCIAGDALAWTAPQGYLSKAESPWRCQWLSAGSDDNQRGQEKDEMEEEKEPDCD